MNKKKIPSSAVGVIKKSGSKYCIFFSDGRKECFSSKKQAEKREQQIKYFKHKDSHLNESEANYAMANCNIIEKYSSDNGTESIYVVSDQGKIRAFLARFSSGEAGKEGSSESEYRENEIEIYKLDAEFSEIDKYENIIETFSNLTVEKEKQLELSDVVISNQMIIGGHTHSVSIKRNEHGIFYGETEDNEDHKHYVYLDDYGFMVSSSRLEIGGIQYSHYHLVLVKG